MRGAAAFAALEPRAGASLAWDEFCFFDFGMSSIGLKLDGENISVGEKCVFH